MPPDLRICLAKAGLPALMTIARVHGEPSQRALAGIRAIRDHLLKVDLDLESPPSMQPDYPDPSVTQPQQDAASSQ